MYHNRYEQDRLSEMNRENIARMMEQYGAPVRKRRSRVRPSLAALLARIPGEWFRRLDRPLRGDPAHQ